MSEVGFSAGQKEAKVKKNLAPLKESIRMQQLKQHTYG
jgi:hypothetical protein